MDINVFLIEFKNEKVKFSTKLFLAEMLKKYGKTSITQTLKELSQIMGFSKSSTQRHLNILKKEGYIKFSTKSNIYSNRKGARFEISLADPFFKKYDREREKDKLHHSTKIKTVFSSEFFETFNILVNEYVTEFDTLPSTYKCDDLLPIVLALFLRLADRKGVVVDYGLAMLAQCLGIGKSRLKKQIEVLKMAGVIRRTVSGMSSGKLFGKKNSIYYLNLESESFLSERNYIDITLVQKDNVTLSIADINIRINPRQTPFTKGNFKDYIFTIEDITGLKISKECLVKVQMLFSNTKITWLVYFQETINIYASKIIDELLVYSRSKKTKTTRLSEEALSSVKSKIKKQIKLQMNFLDDNFKTEIIYTLSALLANSIYRSIKNPESIGYVNVHQINLYDLYKHKGKVVSNRGNTCFVELFYCKKLLNKACELKPLSMEKEIAFGLRSHGFFANVNWDVVSGVKDNSKK